MDIMQLKCTKTSTKLKIQMLKGGGGLHQSWIRLCRVPRRNAKWVSNQVVCETCIYGYRKFLRKLICKENLKCSQRWYKSVWRKSFLYISKCAIFFVSQVSYKSMFMCLLSMQFKRKSSKRIVAFQRLTSVQFACLFSVFFQCCLR